MFVPDDYEYVQLRSTMGERGRLGSLEGGGECESMDSAAAREPLVCGLFGLFELRLRMLIFFSLRLRGWRGRVGIVMAGVFGKSLEDRKRA